MTPDALLQFKNTAIAQILEAGNLEELKDIRRQFLGKTSTPSEALKHIRDLPSDQRSIVGKLINEIKKDIESAIDERISFLTNTADRTPAAKPDLTIPGERINLGRLHPLTIVTEELNAIFNHLGFSVYDGPELETDEYNFERTNLPKDHPARDLWDTIFIEKPNIMLRTHTSSVEARALAQIPPPFRIVIPGKTYRFENVNQSNHFVFNQYQGVVVGKSITLSCLKGTLEFFVREFFGKDKKTRFRNKYYPEVEPTGGMDIECGFCKGKGCPVCKGRGWLEMLGCGMIHPNLLTFAGLSPKEWTGFAFGMGLDRIVMERYKINDIRNLYNGCLIY